MEKRVWIKSGIVEEIDERQARLLALVLEKIRLYYHDLYQTRPCYRYPLTLSRLMKLCRRSSQSITMALRLLANTIPEGSQGQPPVYYDRVSSGRNKSHRPYRIFLRKSPNNGDHGSLAGGQYAPRSEKEEL